MIEANQPTGSLFLLSAGNEKLNPRDPRQVPPFTPSNPLNPLNPKEECTLNAFLFLLLSYKKQSVIIFLQL